MNRDESMVGAWLESQGHAVCHLERGDDPPDLVVDGNIAVEVTTIASYAHRTLWDFMEGVCRALGPAENGRGYFLGVRSEDEALLQHQDRGKVAAIKRDLRRYAKLALRNHYRSPNATVLGPGQAIDFLPTNGRIRLPHGVEIQIITSIRDNTHDVKYEVAAGGGKAVWVVPHLIEAIQAAICKKTNNQLIQRRARKYTEWWLVVTDPAYARNLGANEAGAITESIEYRTPWRRVMLAYLFADQVARVVDLTRAGM